MASITTLNCNTPVFKKERVDDTDKFQPLPKPSGHYPYHLSLHDIIPKGRDEQVVFHMVGDTGSVRNPSFQKLVCGEMARQYLESVCEETKPQFLYHLGDVVYNYGEAEQYHKQFFAPYRNYPGPIFAIAGNHDSDVNPDSLKPYHSLDAFTNVFCDTVQKKVRFSGGEDRKSMIQPNVYWTLQTPLASIIGLHSNVPKYGFITPEQRNWFLRELKAAKLESPRKALIVCVHHAPYSADTNHGSSLNIIEFLEGAFGETGMRPDIVFSGHVHNYQRFEKRYKDGVTTPYLVAGAGGFDQLHPLASFDDDRYTLESPLFKGVKLINFCDSKHGFLKIAIAKNSIGLILTGEYYSIPHKEQSGANPIASLTDRFVLKIR